MYIKPGHNQHIIAQKWNIFILHKDTKFMQGNSHIFGIQPLKKLVKKIKKDVDEVQYLSGRK